MTGTTSNAAASNSLGPFGDVIVSMLATIVTQDLIKIRENTKAALDKKRAAGVELSAH